jgi:hypothetical protein
VIAAQTKRVHLASASGSVWHLDKASWLFDLGQEIANSIACIGDLSFASVMIGCSVAEGHSLKCFANVMTTHRIWWRS